MNRIKIGFVPVNDVCVGCGTEVKKTERQEVTWDRKDRCRRVCRKCIQDGYLDKPFKVEF